jgi:hypothetical protein
MSVSLYVAFSYGVGNLQNRGSLLQHNVTEQRPRIMLVQEWPKALQWPRIAFVRHATTGITNCVTLYKHLEKHEINDKNEQAQSVSWSPGLWRRVVLKVQVVTKVSDERIASISRSLKS